MAELSPVVDTGKYNHRCRDLTSSSLSRSSDDLSAADVPPPLPTSPVPSEPVRSSNSDLEELQVC